MTKLICARDGDEFSILAKGHAGFAPIGKDIVCAGISILLQTLIVHLNTEEYDLKEGALWVHGQGENAVAAYELTMTGLRLLEYEYGRYIEVQEGCTIISQSPLV